MREVRIARQAEVRFPVDRDAVRERFGARFRRAGDYTEAALLGAAAAKARRALLASYPRDRLLTRAFSRLENLCFRLVGKRFRSYVHPPAVLERAAAARGLTRSRVSRGLVWETAQYDAPRF